MEKELNILKEMIAKHDPTLKPLTKALNVSVDELLVKDKEDKK